MTDNGNKIQPPIGEVLEAPEATASKMSSKAVEDFTDKEELVIKEKGSLIEDADDLELEQTCSRNTLDSIDYDDQCGFYQCGQPPAWLQRLATRRIFLIVFCLSSVIQGMFYPYFISCLTTIEKLFQISSQTTGVIMSTTEIGQIGGSLLLTYYGGRGHRPRWIASSMIFIGISVFLCCLPHFLFGEELVTQFLASAPTQEDPLSTANVCLDPMQHDFSLMENNENGSLFNQKSYQPCIKPSKYTKIVLALFSMALLGIGIGQPAIYNLGIPYIDDNVASQDSPTYFGTTIGVRIFGPTLGFVLGSLCMRLPIDPFSKSAYYPTDPRWIGAWWLGLLFISLTLISASILMMMFPKKLPSARSLKTFTQRASCDPTSISTMREVSKMRRRYYSALQPGNRLLDGPQVGAQHSSSTISPCYSPVETLSYYSLEEASKLNIPADSEEFKSSESYLQCSPPSVKGLTHTHMKKRSLQDFLAVIRRLVTNRILVLRTFSSVFHLLPISGLYTFLPKYLETQFRVTVHSAAMISGVGGILVMGIGIFVSGFVIRKMNPSPRAVTFWIALTSILYSVGMVVLAFLGCSHNDLVGQVGDKGTSLHFMPPCERLCETCDTSLFSPICSSDGKTYFSACHAGCTAVNLRNNSKELIFSNCECLEEGVTATLRFCDIHCSAFVWYIAVFCIFVIIHSTSEVGGMLVTLRCVKSDDKAMALGFISVAIGLFGNVPCPILYGAVIDHACIIWRESCNGIGACQLYDPDSFRSYFHGITAALMFVAFLIDILVWYFAKDITFEDDLNAASPGVRAEGTRIKASSISSQSIELPVSSSVFRTMDEELYDDPSLSQTATSKGLAGRCGMKLQNPDQAAKSCSFENGNIKPSINDIEKFLPFPSKIILCPFSTSSLPRLDTDKLRIKAGSLKFTKSAGDYTVLPLTASISTPAIETNDFLSDNSNR